VNGCRKACTLDGIELTKQASLQEDLVDGSLKVRATSGGKLIN